MSFRLPSNEIHRVPARHETTQVRGPDIAITCGVRGIGDWREPARDDYQILILPEAACEAEMTWRTTGGKTRTRRICGPHICTVERQTAFAMRWMREAACVSLRVSRDLVARNGGRAAMSGVTIEPEFEYACADIEIRDSNEMFAKLCRAPGSLSPDRIHGMGLVQASRITQARSRPPLARRPLVLSAAQMGRISEFISAHIQDGISVKMLARVACVGPDQFARVFKQTTGMPPHQYVLRCRQKFAQRLLATGDMRKGDAAAAAGFNDQSHYRRSIRRECEKFGENPVLS